MHSAILDMARELAIAGSGQDRTGPHLPDERRPVRPCGRRTARVSRQLRVGVSGDGVGAVSAVAGSSSRRHRAPDDGTPSRPRRTEWAAGQGGLPWQVHGARQRHAGHARSRSGRPAPPPRPHEEVRGDGDACDREHDDDRLCPGCFAVGLLCAPCSTSESWRTQRARRRSSGDVHDAPTRPAPRRGGGLGLEGRLATWALDNRHGSSIALSGAEQVERPAPLSSTTRTVYGCPTSSSGPHGAAAPWASPLRPRSTAGGARGAVGVRLRRAGRLPGGAAPLARRRQATTPGSPSTATSVPMPTRS